MGGTQDFVTVNTAKKYRVTGYTYFEPMSPNASERILMILNDYGA